MIDCVRCGAVKPEEEFALSPRMKRGRHSWCRQCMRDYNKAKNAALTPEQRAARNAHRRTYSAANARAWRAKNPGRSSAHTRKYRQGISQEQYDALLYEQDGQCAIAGCEREALHVDHDHRCCPGKRACGQCVRGVLCFHCNTMLGQALDDPTLLRAAADYIESRRSA